MNYGKSKSELDGKLYLIVSKKNNVVISLISKKYHFTFK